MHDTLATLMDADLAELLETEVERPQPPSDDELDRMSEEEHGAWNARCDAYTIVTLLRSAYLAGMVAGQQEALEVARGLRARLDMHREVRAIRDEARTTEAEVENLKRCNGALRDELDLMLGLRAEGDGSIFGLAGDARIVQSACRSFKRDFGFWPDWWGLLARLMNIDRDGLRDMSEREARHRIQDALQICRIWPGYAAPPPPDDEEDPDDDHAA